MDFIDREIAFHPFLPQLEFSRWNDTCLWDFNASIGKQPDDVPNIESITNHSRQYTI